MNELVVRSKDIKIDVQVWTPETMQDYESLASYEPSKGLLRVKTLIGKYRDIACQEFERLMAF